MKAIIQKLKQFAPFRVVLFLPIAHRKLREAESWSWRKVGLLLQQGDERYLVVDRFGRFTFFKRGGNGQILPEHSRKGWKWVQVPVDASCAACAEAICDTCAPKSYGREK